MTNELLFDKDRLENLLDVFLTEIEKRGVKGNVFLVGGAASYWITKRTIGEVTLKVASPELMLAMKIKASRGRRDNEDVVELLRILELSSVEEVLTIYENVYAQEEMNLEMIELVTQFIANKP
jgi:hypothetical protein